jgi:hypothetical protein
VTNPDAARPTESAVRDTAPPELDRRADEARSLRRSALIVGIGSLLLVAGMTAHPTVHPHDSRELITTLATISVSNRIVHGGLLIVMCVVFAGWLGLCASLGWSAVRVRAGAVFYGAGVVCMISAALIDGFVITHLAAGRVDASDAEIQALLPVIRLCFDVNQISAAAGIAAMSLAIFCWSLALFGRGRGAAIVAAIGFVAALLPALGLAHGGAHVSLHMMLAVIVVQAIWNVSVAVWMFRGR